MVQLVAILGAILFIFIIISSDKKSGSAQYDSTINQHTGYFSKSEYPQHRVIAFDIYKLKGDLLNIDRRIFREGLKKALEGSSKFKVSYNPNIKMVVNVTEKVDSLQRYRDRKNGKRYYIVKKRVTIIAEYALFKNSNITYFIDKLVYQADIKAGSFINYDDALYKINKRLYWIVGKKVANKLKNNYEIILGRIRY